MKITVKKMIKFPENRPVLSLIASKSNWYKGRLNNASF